MEKVFIVSLLVNNYEEGCLLKNCIKVFKNEEDGKNFLEDVYKEMLEEYELEENSSDIEEKRDDYFKMMVEGYSEEVICKIKEYEIN